MQKHDKSEKVIVNSFVTIYRPSLKDLIQEKKSKAILDDGFVSKPRQDFLDISLVEVPTFEEAKIFSEDVKITEVTVKNTCAHYNGDGNTLIVGDMDIEYEVKYSDGSVKLYSSREDLARINSELNDQWWFG